MAIIYQRKACFDAGHKQDPHTKHCRMVPGMVTWESPVREHRNVQSELLVCLTNEMGKQDGQSVRGISRNLPITIREDLSVWRHPTRD